MLFFLILEIFNINIIIEAMNNFFWKPSIDNWIIEENDANVFDADVNVKYGSDAMAGGMPIKSEEEENDIQLEQPYKGIKTLTRLREQINQILGDIHELSKVDKDHKDSINPYENIIEMIDNPDLKTMLTIASNEIKKKNITSF